MYYKAKHIGGFQMFNLGQLTLDLVARIGSFTGPLDKAERASKKNATAISKHQREITGAIGSSLKSLAGWAAGFVAFGAVKSFVTNSYAAADAIGKVAATAGITTDTLQEMRHAASLNGVSFDELDNGIQKLNKNIGDLRAGSGSLYTYLTKTDKALLSQVQSAKSTDDALDAVFKSMKNIESSSDKSALAVAAFGRSGQRLAIMADTYEDLRNEARELGLVIDSDLIKGAEEANDKMDTMARIIKTQLTGAFIELAPAIIGVAQNLTNATVALVKFFNPKNETKVDRYQQLSDELKDLEFALKDAEETGKESFATITKNGDVFTNTIGSARAQIKNLKDELGKLPSPSTGSGSGDGQSQQQIEMYKKAFSSLGTITRKTYDVMRAEYEKDRDEFISLTGDKETAQAMYSKNIESLNKKMYYSEEAEECKELTSQIDSQISSLLKQYDTYGMSSDQLELYKLKLSGATEEEVKAAETILENINALISQTKLEEDRIKLIDEGIELTKELRNETEKYTDEINHINELYYVGAISADTYGRAIENIKDKSKELEELDPTYWEEYLSSMESNMQNMDSQFGDLFATAIMDSENLGEAFKTMMEGMASATLSAVGKMIAQWIIYKVSKHETDRASQAAAIPQFVSNAEAMALQAGINAYASAAAIPYAGWTIAPGAMAAALAVTEPMAAAIGTLAVAGMAHDGIDSVPETGTWLLKKGERVVTSETSKRLDNTLSRINSHTSPIQSAVMDKPYSTTKEAHYHYHSDGPTFLNRAQMKDAARMLLAEMEREKTRIGAI